MTIALFGNTSKSETMIEVSHILEFMKRNNVNVLLSQEIRQELNMRELPAFPEDWEGEQQPENIYGEPIDFAVSVGGDGTFLTTAARIYLSLESTADTSVFLQMCRPRMWIRFWHSSLPANIR